MSAAYDRMRDPESCSRWLKLRLGNSESALTVHLAADFSHHTLPSSPPPSPFLTQPYIITSYFDDCNLLHLVPSTCKPSLKYAGCSAQTLDHSYHASLSLTKSTPPLPPFLFLSPFPPPRSQELGGERVICSSINHNRNLASGTHPTKPQ